MEISEFSVASFDEFMLSVKCFAPETPRAAVQVIHGMSEHKERYDAFAETLAANGFAVVISDLRGHGGSVGGDGIYGHFGVGDGADTLIRDQSAIRACIRERFPDLPVSLFAHSMGTLIARNYIREQDVSVRKLVLSGAPCYRAGSGIACALCKMIIAFSGPTGCNRLIKSFAPGGGREAFPNAWLSYNRENVEAYNADPLCGFPFTNAGYLTLYELDRRLRRPWAHAPGNPEMEILFLAGQDDPVTGGDSGLRRSAEFLRKAGYERISMKVYEQMRHEILQENGRDRVTNEVLAFLEKEQP